MWLSCRGRGGEKLRSRSPLNAPSERNASNRGSMPRTIQQLHRHDEPALLSMDLSDDQRLHLKLLGGQRGLGLKADDAPVVAVLEGTSANSQNSTSPVSP